VNLHKISPAIRNYDARVFTYEVYEETRDFDEDDEEINLEGRLVERWKENGVMLGLWVDNRDSTRYVIHDIDNDDDLEEGEWLRVNYTYWTIWEEHTLNADRTPV